MSFNAPAWLRQLVREEIRPLLSYRQRTAIEALNRWQASRALHLRHLEEWEARRHEFLAAQPPSNIWMGWLKRRHWPEDDSMFQPPNSTLIVGRVWHEGIRLTVSYWGPPDLLAESKPPVEDPLRHLLFINDPVEPTRDREFTNDECVVSLMAVHDEVRDPRDRIGPEDNAGYEALCANVKDLTEEHLPYLREMLRRTSAVLEKDSPFADSPPPNAKPELETPPGTNPSLKEPCADAFAAYRLYIIVGRTQKELSEQLTNELHRPISQGQISRWLKAVRAWLTAGNVLPPLEEAGRPAAVDPERLDLGQRQDRRTHRQRERRRD